MADSYKIVFDGILEEGQEHTSVKARLATLFRTNTARIERLFHEAPLIVKCDLSKESALKYQHAILQAGAACHIEKDQSAQTQTTPQKTSYSTPPAATPALRICPKCGFEQDSGYQECMRCGIIFSRLQKETESSEIEDADESHTQGMPALSRRKRLRHTDETMLELEPLRVDREGWLSLLAGAVITGVVMFVPFLTYIFSYLKILVHEFGHALFGWLFAYPTIPAFDFMYGGGVAIHNERQMLLLVFVYLGFGWLLVTFRKNIPTLIIIGIIIGVFSLGAFTELHSLMILFMGHGAELAFAGLFLYRAISGSSIVVALERPLYAFVGLFIEVLDIRFAYQLFTSHAHRVDYEAAKGGGHWMDFSRIAEKFLHVDLTAVAGFFLICCFFPPVLAFLFYRYRMHVFSVLVKILDTQPLLNS